jgi:hypothetical protein
VVRHRTPCEWPRRCLTGRAVGFSRLPEVALTTTARVRRSWIWATAGLGLLVAVVIWAALFRPDPAGSSPPRHQVGLPPHFRAFSPTSYWNTPLPPGAPVDPRSADMMRFIENHSVPGYVTFPGISGEGVWGNPIYQAKRGDPTYVVRNTCSFRQPPEFGAMRIPKGAQQDPTSDGAMTVYDRQNGVVYALWHSSFDATSKTWSACGGAVYYLYSNGLEGTLPQSNEKRNFGHRGVPPSTYAVTLQEIRSGAIHHVLKLAVDLTSQEFVFPMVGSDGRSNDPDAPPEGARIRIDPSIDLSQLHLRPAALIVARALQDYGAIIGDQDGGPTALKLENTVAEGLGQEWDRLLGNDSLARLPLRDYEIVALGYDPTRP